MKKLLSLSIALLSLNLYGAEISKHGLEGWGKKEGVSIIVVDYSKFDKTFNVKAIENQVELKLRLAGIKVIAGGATAIVNGLTRDSININMNPTRIGRDLRVVGYHLAVSAGRRMTFKHNGKEYILDSSNHGFYGGPCTLNYRKAIDEMLDMLLLDYLKANPITPKGQ